MKRALIISFSNLTHDARVQRQVQWLQKKFEVTALVYSGSTATGIELLTVPRPVLSPITRAALSVLLLFRFYHRAYWLLYRYQHTVRELRNRTFDLIVANDVESLPLAFACRQNAKIWIDAHEFAPRHFEEKRYWRIFFQGFNRYLCRTYLPEADWMTTVSEGLRAAYEQEFPVRPEVLTNATRYHDFTPQPVDPAHIRIIHHGGANPSRQLELLIDMMEYTDERFTLDLMLITPPLSNPKTSQYIHHLKALAEGQPRIVFRPPVPSEQIVNFIRQYDLGIFILPPVNFNYANTLPNKLFDFIQARLGIAIGPTPEMAHLVTRFQMGIVASSFNPKEMATLLNALTTDDIFRFKQQAHEAARWVSAEHNERLVHNALQRLLLVD